MSLDIVAAGTHIEATLGQQELLLLRALPSLLVSDRATDDPAYERLFPVPYGNDEADREFRRLAAPEIGRARQRDAEIFAHVMERCEAGPAALSRGEAEACARAVGTGRLTVAARHGLFDQDAFDASQNTPVGAIVAFLGLVQDELVHALAELEEVAS